MRLWLYIVLQGSLLVLLFVAILSLPSGGEDSTMLRLYGRLALILLASQLIDWIVFPRWKRRRVKYLLGTLWMRLLLGAMVTITLFAAVSGYLVVTNQRKILRDFQSEQIQSDLRGLVSRFRWTEDGARLDIPLFHRDEDEIERFGDRPRRGREDDWEEPGDGRPGRRGRDDLDDDREDRRPERREGNGRGEWSRPGRGRRGRRQTGPGTIRLPAIVYMVDGRGRTLLAWPESLDPATMEAIRNGAEDTVLLEPRLPPEKGDSTTIPVGSEQYRVAGVRLHRPGAPFAGPDSVTLYVAEPTGSIERVIDDTIDSLLSGWGAMAVSLYLLMYLLTWLLLRPLGPLSAQIAARGQDDLTPLETDKLPAELVGMVERFNGLLGRVDQAIRRERTLTADIAHELRTPLAGARSVLEVSLSQARTEADYRDAMDQVLEIVESTQQMIEKLLMLARLDSGQITPTAVRPLPLRAMVRRQWQAVAEQADRRGIQLDDGHLSDDLTVQADPALLEVVLGNLLSNAVNYAPDGARVAATGRAVEGQVRLAVTNPAAEIPADPEVVFDRFWRGQAARSQTGLHCGLGLSLVRRCAQAMGGSARADTVGGTFTVEVRLPTCGKESGQ